MIEIKEHLSMADWNEFHSFVSESFRPDHPLCSKEYLQWQFKMKENGGKATILCVWENGRLLGINGYIPLPVHWGRLDNPMVAVWLAHWRVRSDAPRGVGGLLTRKIQEMFPLVLSLNASQLGVPIFKVLGWHYFPNIPRYLCVLDKKKSSRMLSPDANESDLNSFIIKLKSSDSFLLKDVIPNQENYHPQWNLYSELAFGTLRSLDYLIWRYIEHPTFKYHIVVTGQADRPAVCVYRIEEAFGDLETPVGRIVDFFFPTDSQGLAEGRKLMGDVLQHLKNIGCAYADILCSNSTYGRTIKELGGGQEPADRLILPMRLTPIQHIKREQNVVYYGQKGLLTPAMDQMYLTKSDIDGDHPAYHTNRINDLIFEKNRF